MCFFFCFFVSCGCPSPKVAGHGCFGVRLMLDPKVCERFYWMHASLINVEV